MAVRKSQGGNMTPTPAKNVLEVAAEGKQGTPLSRRKEAVQSLEVKQNAEQESPARSEGTQQTPTKRKAEEDPASPAKRIRLEDYIPAEQVFDFGDIDSRKLRLTDFDDSVELGDVENVCGEGVVEFKRQEQPKRVIHVIYETEEAARAALEKLKSTTVKGTTFTATSCARNPVFESTIIFLKGIPKHTKRDDVRKLFPGCRVQRWLGRTARLEFDSPSHLQNAIKNPVCHAIGEKKLMFAYDYARDYKNRLSKARRDATKQKQGCGAEAGKGKPSSSHGKKKGMTPAKKQALTKTPPTTLTSKMVAVSPAGKGTASPGGKKKSPKGKTPQKQAPVAKTPGPAKSPQTFKPVGAGKSPLPKQSPRTPKEAPKGTPKGVKSTGKKQKALF